MGLTWKKRGREEIKTKGKELRQNDRLIKMCRKFSDSRESCYREIITLTNMERGFPAGAFYCTQEVALYPEIWPRESLAALLLNRVHRECLSPKWYFSPIHCTAWASWQDEQGAISPNQGRVEPLGAEIVSNQAQLCRKSSCLLLRCQMVKKKG